ncbi:MAG: MoaD/ThiS family protein [Desulfofustis sp. PB-SRB1]|jgi:sulfur carrier protein ThiS|nr:MoaD/ThiS family protein [Desulfofustis sp. PB-SRB1]MBM1001733.1 MoaD/ThiS family protein [Desulfofustis sp. PB-SRB1]HBH29383.1 MoaD/ThiS family protein [Desulfofustis sp.]
MIITLNCFASLKPYTPDGGTLELAEGTTVEAVLTRLGIPQEEIRLIFVNSVHVSPDTVLKDGDRLGIFPPVGGG